MFRKRTPTLRRAMAFAAICSTAFIGSTVAGADAAATRTLRITATASAGQATTATPACDPVGRCVVGWSNTADVVGGMTGEDRSFGSIVIDQATFQYSSTHLSLFTGTITGCGTGTVALHFPLVDGGPAPFSGALEIRPGSGTGGLVGMTGEGTYRVTPGATGSTTDLSLRVKCRR